jgi:putative sterol carrier protein
MDEWTLLLERLKQTFQGVELSGAIRLRFPDDERTLRIGHRDAPDRIEENGAGESATEFEATRAVALKIFSRELDPTKALATGKLKMSGDLGLALKVSELLKP